MIRAVLFDFGQTLVDSADGFRAAEKELQEKAFADLDILSRDLFLEQYRRIRTALHGKSNFSRFDLLRDLYATYGIAADGDRLSLWEGQYWERVQAMTRIFPEAPDVLADLASRFLLGLVTNTQGQKGDPAHRLRAYPELERFFPVIVVAGEGGIPAKPAPAPFLRCLEMLNVRADEAMYVGDDWRIDVCGARETGLHPVWLKHETVTRRWPEAAFAVPAITNLRALTGLPELL